MNYVVTLVYNSLEMMKASIARFDETFGLPRSQYTHVFVHQHWPKGPGENLNWLLKYAEEKGNVLLLDPGKNLGLAKGFNYALSKINLQKNDIVFAYDPDMFPGTSGWGNAMLEVFKDEHFHWLSCWTPHTPRETTERGFEDVIISGVNVRIPKQACLNSVSAFKGEFLLKSDGLHEPNPFYGGLECAMFPKLGDFHQGYLKDYCEDYAPDELIDLDYRKWKWDTCHGELRGNQMEFSKWLEDHGKI